MSRKLLLEDLKRSGLTQADISKLGIKLLTAEQTKKQTTKHNVAAYTLPYFNVQGKATTFFRLRLLEAPKQKKSFAGNKEKDIRYWQPSKALPQLYFPKNIKWKEVIKNKKTPIYITEGEKKAAKACKEGFPCVALGGVWNWKSNKRNVPLIKDFDTIDIEGREIILVFDNDITYNVNVMFALNALSRVLTNKGATVKLINLPVPDSGDKLGLDDYLVRYGVEGFKQLTVEVYPEAQELWKLNDEFCFLKDLNVVYHLESGLMIKNKNQLVQMHCANRTVEVWDGDKFKVVNAAEEWLKWRFRRTHKTLVYEPGQPTTLENNSLNLWKGWGVEPEKGDVSPWISLMDYVFGGDSDAYTWFEQWLAYPLQHPGTKQYSAVLLHGRYQGTGKSLVGYLIGDIYGQNFSVVTQDELHSTYNDWCIHKQFLLGEEITGTDRRRDADRIKNIITREQLQVSIKYQPGYVLRDCANSLYTSNHADAMFVEFSDRRLFVYEILNPPRSKQFYAKIDKWRRSGGAKHLFHYLLNEVDLRGYKPTEPARMTKAKQEMIALSKSDLDLFSHEILDSPDAVLRVGNVVISRDLFSIDEILQFIDDEDRRPPRIALSKALRRAGFRQYVTNTSQGAKRLWALRNMGAWDQATHNQRSNHYNEHLDKVVHIQSNGKRKYE